MATPTADRSDLDAAAGLPIFQEVLDSLLHEGSLAETLTLISRRVTELGAFDFCGIVLPDADWTHVRLAASHAFPPRYAARLNDTFLAPLDGTPLAGSPTAMAMRLRRTVVLRDALTDESFRPWRSFALEFGYRSLVCAPLVVHGEVLGVLNGYARRPRELSSAQIATVETLASQAALALRMTMLVDAQHETIAKLERSHDIHLRLTSAVIAGADFHAVAQILAGLIGRPVLVTDSAGAAICTSDPPPDPALGADSPGALVGRIRIGAELLGHVVVEESDPASHDLDVRAVEHAATVLALEIVKERVARATEERLRSDFLADLIDGRKDGQGRIAERARHHGLRLGAAHRVVVVALDERPTYQAREQVRRLAGAVLLERLAGSLVGEVGDAVAAAVPVEDAGAESLADVRSALDEARARVASTAPELRLSVGIGAVARTAHDFPASYADARRCVDVLRRLGRAGETMAADDLGLLGLFVDSARPEELAALARQVLGPVLERDARTGSALLQTLEAYLGSGCDARACAASLFVHVNTVKYRLRQVEELCGVSLRDPEDLLRVTMARLIVRLVAEG
ncbi:MAG TPA: helix-turn-helix domain-containing protein [Solirubrobacteraceae bacterium]|nr:helix-turn-helix domain-containing protein [Solirubrobacteraceae bacterium]